MQKKTTKQFAISFNSLSKELLEVSAGLEVAVANLKLVPNDRFAKRAVTMKRNVLHKVKWKLMTLIACDLEITQGIRLNGDVWHFIPTSRLLRVRGD